MRNHSCALSVHTGPAVEIPVFTLVSEGRSMAEAQKFCREHYEELATIFNAEDQVAALRAVSAQSLTDAAWVHSQYHAFWPKLDYLNTPNAKCVIHGQTNGDDLASILTQEDYTAFQSIKETQQYDMWIGLYWKTSTRMWQWSNGDLFPYCVSEPQLGASNCCSLTRQGHGQTEHASLDKIDCSLKREDNTGRG
uniref:C-type lectin domain-containing protein n=1 Tax=Oncorhynchus tshawytscha TaxID=74940 RepID=A0A8C8GLM8_ONCTS